VSLIADIISWALIVAGSLACIVGALGLIRMPDLYTRMHAASVIDPFGAGLILIGLMVQAGFTLVTAKLLFLLVLLLFTSPVATHALGAAALHRKLEPRLAPPEDASSKP
jgi:multicomponent Na+:H+ antiporter subunit G